MTNRKLRRAPGVCAGIVLLVMVVGLVTTSLASQPSQITTNTVYLPLVLREQLSKIHLPLVSANTSRVTTFGIQSATPTRNINFLKPLNVEWIRLNGPNWSEVQPSEGGAYNWNVDSVQAFDQALNALQQNRVPARVIMMITSSPKWATVGESTCGPIKQEHYDKFATFMRAIVQRYPTVKYVELGNEPDIDVRDVTPDSGFGCWGDKDDDADLYGGRAYGEMLKVVYPAIKGVDASVQVLNGGLLLDRPYDQNNRNTRSALFIEGVLASGAGSSFDILNYHSYTYFKPNNPTPNGESTVGFLTSDWKPSYLRGLMQRYGVAEKPLINTEGALLCNVNRDQLDACHDAQASVMGRLYSRAARDRLLALSWYQLDNDGFFSTSLIKPDRSGTRPAYDAYRHARAQFGGAQYVGTLTNQSEGIEGYRFRNGTLNVVVFWSDQNGKTAMIPVPTGSTPRCTDRVGVPIACQNVNGVVSLPATSRTTYVTFP